MKNNPEKKEISVERELAALLSRAAVDRGFAEICTWLRACGGAKAESANIVGPTGSFKAYLTRALYEATAAESKKFGLVVIVPDELAVRAWQKDLQALTTGTVEAWRPRELNVGPAASMSREEEHNHLRILQRLAGLSAPVAETCETAALSADLADSESTAALSANLADSESVAMPSTSTAP
ncbi:MAG: hypothetical protein GX900_03910, partial [Clostridiaceae bacterium]|nr:hypothetical protein [Clostridiaceae bacterium]